MEYSLNRFMGFLQTGEKVIRRTITGESCMVADGYCRLKEDKRSVIVWRATKVDKNVYRNLGVYRILKTGDFYLIKGLNVGGTRLKEIILENTYILRRINKGKKKEGKDIGR